MVSSDVNEVAAQRTKWNSTEGPWTSLMGVIEHNTVTGAANELFVIRFAVHGEVMQYVGMRDKPRAKIAAETML